MNYTLRYAHTKHGRIKISAEGELILCIPYSQEKNEIFKEKMLDKGKKLLQKYHSKKPKILQTHREKEVLLFGEYRACEHISNIDTFLTQQLLESSLPLLEKYSQKIGISYNKFTFGNYKSKRGSCSAEQNIALNFKLVHLPKKFLEYVIIHEVCHLKVKNHSPQFWKCVGEFLPNYKEVRKELKNIKI